MTLLITACFSLLTTLPRMQSGAVTLDAVDNVGSLLERIGKTTGLRFNVDPDVAVITFYARLKNVPVAEAERRIAEITHASWSEKAGILILKRTVEQTRELEEARIATLIPAYTGQLAKLNPGLEQSNPGQAARSFAKSLRSHLSNTRSDPFYGPTDGLLQEILRQVGARRIASLPTFRMALLSNQPTTAESDLPDLTATMDQYKAISEAFAKEITEESMQGVVDKYNFDRLIQAAHRANSVGRILLALYPTFRAVSAVLTVYDVQGNILSDAVSSLKVPPSVPAVLLANPSSQIAWSVDSQSAMALLHSKTISPTQASLLTKLLKEPLEIEAVPGLRGIASTQDQNILCPLTDDLVLPLARKQLASVGDFAAAFSTGGLTLQSGSNWLTGHLAPSHFDPAWFIDRNALQTWEAATLDRSQSWLRRNANLYGQSGEAVSNGLITWIRLKAWPLLHVVEPEQQTPKWALFALGTLSDTDWTELELGHSIAVTPNAERARRVAEWSCSSWQALERVAGTTGPDIETIGSVPFPGGPPDGSTITITPANETVFADLSVDENSWMNTGQMANLACELPPPSGTEEGAIKALKARYNIGKRPNLQIEVHLGPRFNLSCTQPSGDISVIKEAAALSDWPSDIVDDLRAAIRTFLSERGAVTAGPPPLR